MARVPLRQRRQGDFEGLWLITFADLMVQLMAFFAIIYSYSAQDQQKLHEVLGSFQRELGVGSAASTPSVPSGATGILPGSTGLDPARAADLEKQLSDLPAKDGPDVGVRMRIVSFRGGILFPEGSAAVPAVFQPLLTRIAEMASEYPGFTLICEGHAAPGERGPRSGSDPLDLSGQRAGAVIRLLQAQGMDLKLMAAEAHGDAQLEGDTDSAEGRALHRRVKFRFQRVAER